MNPNEMIRQHALERMGSEATEAEAESLLKILRRVGCDTDDYDGEGWQILIQEAVEDAAHAARFRVDDELTMISPHSGTPCKVNFRGMYGDEAVVWTGRTQMSVPLEWLSK